MIETNTHGGFLKHGCLWLIKNPQEEISWMFAPPELCCETYYQCLGLCSIALITKVVRFILISIIHLIALINKNLHSLGVCVDLIHTSRRF